MVNLIHVPFIPGLRVNEKVDFARKYIDINKYLPEFKNKAKLPERAWVCYVGKT